MSYRKASSTSAPVMNSSPRNTHSRVESQREHSGDSASRASTARSVPVSTYQSQTPRLEEEDSMRTSLSVAEATERVVHRSRTSSGGSSLHRKAPSLSYYQSVDIRKHYELNHQILQAFESLYDKKLYRVAYAMGMQFIETALLEIPKHGYFFSVRHERERLESNRQAAQVAQLLTEILQEERSRELRNQQHHTKLSSASMPQVGTDIDAARLEKLTILAVQQQDPTCTPEQYEKARGQTESELRAMECIDNGWVLCGMGKSASAASWSTAVSEGLSNLFCPSAAHSESPQTVELKPPVPYDSRKSSYKSESRIDVPDATPIATATPVDPASFVSLERSVTAPAWAPENWNVVIARTSDTAIAVPLPEDHGSSGLSTEPPPLLRSGIEEDRMDDLNDLDSSFNKRRLSLLRAPSEDSIALQKALYLSGMEVSNVLGDESVLQYENYRDSSTSLQVKEDQYDSYDSEIELEKRIQSPTTPTKKSATSLELSTLSTLYHEDFDSLLQSGRVRVSFVDTYQGRLPDSTNGCTVIAPLLCIHHLLDADVIPDMGLRDADIVEAIDYESPAVLNQLRNQLGLSRQAFLIPSDAHHYLIENGQLSQQQFVNVYGGNVLDESHLTAFVDAFKNDTKYSKLAANFFFHEHVIAILKLRRSRNNNSCWYDVVDSLPLKETLARPGESKDQLIFRLNLTNEQQYFTDAFLPKAARIRCLDAEALVACLRWYACSRFTKENADYIDQYEWNDSQCDFDPRVFQAFVWGNHE